jgi:hypothetical protein
MNTAFALFVAAREMDGSCVEVEPDGTCTVVPDPFARVLLGALLVVPGVAIFVIVTSSTCPIDHGATASSHQEVEPCVAHIFGPQQLPLT